MICLLELLLLLVFQNLCTYLRNTSIDCRTFKQEFLYFLFNLRTDIIQSIVFFCCVQYDSNLNSAVIITYIVYLT